MTNLPRLSVFAAVALLLGAYAVAGGSVQAASHDGLQPPIDIPGGAECAFRAANDISAATFLCVEGVSPWAVLVVNPPVAGIDSIGVTYDAESRTLTITVSEDDPTATVTILVNKAFLEEHVDGFASDRDLRMTNGVMYEGEGGHPMAAGQAMLVFQITHFSTQTITIGPGSTVLVGVVIALVAVALVAAVGLRKKRK